MRDALAHLNGKKSVFTATFKRFGWKRFMGEYVGKTLLFVDVKDSKGDVATDHIWFRMTKGFEKLDLKPGDIVSFHAKIDTYAKHRGEDWDYHLEYPSNIVKVNSELQERLA